MTTSALTAISPIDGRYHQKTKALQPLLSEYGLMKHRLMVEVEWLIALSDETGIPEVPSFSADAIDHLKSMVRNFSKDDAKTIKDIEQTTNHDVKAIEYFLKQQIQTHDELSAYQEFVHFACTSADINNLAYALMLKETRSNVIAPLLQQLSDAFKQQATQYADVAMLARTHGQAATPTTMGKEFANYASRFKKATALFNAATIEGKINGAVGNFNAHSVTYPDVDWPQFSQRFVEHLGLSYNGYTAQIEPHDYIASLFDSLVRANTILIDFNRDIWTYISLGYFSQKTVAGEVGSSTMPHKVNPIQFENSEGNLIFANAILRCLANELPTSRLQRDLVDSTLLRNIGVGVAHSLIAYQSTLAGVEKLAINKEKISDDLNNNWEVLGEAIQTIMRRYGIEQPYEKLKALTRGKKVDAEAIKEFVEDLALPNDAKAILLELTPNNYIGLADKLASKLE